MNQMLHNAYTNHQRGKETVRETEARALLSCASRLEEVRNPDSSREAFGDAVRHNQQLWTIFQVCLCEPDNPLPRELKVLLLNLSRYIDKVSFRALGDNNRDLLRSLININRMIATGLSAKQPGDAPAPSIRPPMPAEGEKISPMMTSV